MDTTSSLCILGRLNAPHYHLPAGVVVNTADSCIVFVNRLAQEVLDWKEAGLLGMDLEITAGSLCEDRSVIRPKSTGRPSYSIQGKNSLGIWLASSKRV